MAVYLTKNMLSKMRNVTYAIKKNHHEESRNADHWQTLTADTYVAFLFYFIALCLSFALDNF